MPIEPVAEGEKKRNIGEVNLVLHGFEVGTLVLAKLKEETQMVDLRNTCILVKTEEENEMLLKEAEKQGFHWYSKGNCKPLPGQHFPDILKFCNNKDVVHSVRIGVECDAFYEASELLGTKEMTAREFANRIADIRNCRGCNCSECVLSESNTRCKKHLCDIYNWEDNIDEVLEIAKSIRLTVPSPEEKAISTIEKFIENPDRAALNDEFVESLKLVVEKLKEVKIDGEINT